MSFLPSFRSRRATGNPFVGGLICILVGLGVWALIGQQQTINCARAEAGAVSCKVTYTWMGVIPESSARFDAVNGARVGVNHGDDGDTYRIEFVTTAGMKPVTDGYNSSNPSDAVARINQFAASSQAPQVVIKESGVSGWLCIPMVFLLVGVLFFVGGIRQALSFFTGH